MNDNTVPPSEELYTTTLPSDLGQVRLTLERKGQGVALEVSRGGLRLGSFPVPGGLTAFDLPFWITSVLRTASPNLNVKALRSYEADIRNRFPGSGDLITVCIGPKTDFHRCCILHFDRDAFRPQRQGNTVSFTALGKGARFNDQVWTIHLHHEFVWFARATELHLRRSHEALVSLDCNITGIMACNDDRWETAGLPLEEVLRTASDRNITLRRFESDGPGFAFRPGSGKAE